MMLNAKISVSPTSTPGRTFRFVTINYARALRGVQAARVEVADVHGDRWMWMSRADILRNIESFGDCVELQKALTAYGGWN